MKKQPSHNRHMLSKNSILLLVMLVCIFLSTLAWFASAEEATATGLTISTKTPTTLELALETEDRTYPKVDKAYSSTLNFGDAKTVIKSMITDVTSDGLNFIIPSTSQNSGVRYVLEDKEWKRATANADYISIPFYVRSESPNIYMSGASQVNAKLVEEDGTNVANPSEDFPTISRNGIVGAMRVSIVDMTKSIDDVDYTPRTADRKLLWIPRPDLYLSTPNNNNWELMKNINPQSMLSEAEQGDTYIHYFYQIANSGETDAVSGTGVSRTSLPKNLGAIASAYAGDGITPTLGVDKQIGNGKIFDESVGESGGDYVDMELKTINGKDYYVYKFVMNIWIEGSDAEARRALNDGNFDIDIRFCTKTN